MTQHFALQNNAADISAKVIFFSVEREPLSAIYLIKKTKSKYNILILLCYTLSNSWILTGRKPRDGCDDDWDGFRNAPCPHYNGTLSSYLVFFFVSYCVPYVWSVRLQLSSLFLVWKFSKWLNASKLFMHIKSLNVKIAQTARVPLKFVKRFKFKSELITYRIMFSPQEKVFFFYFFIKNTCWSPIK